MTDPLDRAESSGVNWARRPILLASRSPRRRRLLREAGLDVEVIESGFDDTGLLPGDETSVESWVESLARRKAESAYELWRTQPRAPAGLILAGDTVVEHEGAVIGQPRDVEHARIIIERLNDAPHQVITGVAIVDCVTGAMETLVDSACVTVGHIDSDAIDGYLQTDEWRGKAGAYNLSERLDAGWPIRYTGDPATIMGLPMRKLLDRLR